MSMTVQKISISLPQYLVEHLAAKVGKRQVSGFIAEAVECKILSDVRKSSVDRFLSHRARLPKVAFSTIKKAIARGRL